LQFLLRLLLPGLLLLQFLLQLPLLGVVLVELREVARLAVRVGRIV
jgi:hypothetical protein